MPVSSLSGIVNRAETGWPLNSVPYSQSGTWTDGYRRDCSGYASMALGLDPPGLSTVTLVTSGAVRRIDWADMRPGDLVMLGGPGTAGDAGHVGVVTAVNRLTRTYTILHQGGGLGPDRWSGPIGTAVRSGMVPYRSTHVRQIEEDDMALSDEDLARVALYVLQGSDDRGYPPGSLPKPVRDALRDRNVTAQLNRAVADLATQLAGGVDLDELAGKLAPLITAQLADAVADKLAQRLKD